ncbi:protein of unknown function [Halopseudomonas litoralis]|uniref:GYF domain-containing protein n=1 Tax=Halopseudomonas litoralis TaxID=797277 RepID=A0A1H1LDH3_9GAMM|nr:DUF4339 domain-containing protein [Halopseudomonas litoralis]SDR72614.1 protein of unknown function [Halopseudomonas litoralis]
MTTWHYVESGAQVGPLTIDEMKAAVGDGKITPSTKVWPGEGDWIHASETLLSEFFGVHEATTPPPLAGEDIDNKFMWVLVTVPIIGVIIDLIAGTVLFLPSIIANIALCMLDEKKLKAAGHAAPEHWSVFIVPVYIWKRAALLKHKKHYFGAWVAAFVLSILIDIGGAQAAIEEAACPIVTDIIKEQLYGSAKCMGVAIDKEVTTGFYKATATLDNGNELLITIEERDDGMIYVQIPNQ